MEYLSLLLFLVLMADFFSPITIARADSFEHVRIVGVGGLGQGERFKCYLIFRGVLYNTDLTIDIINGNSGLLLSYVESMFICDTGSINNALSGFEKELKISEGLEGSLLLYIKTYNAYDKAVYREIRFSVDSNNADGDFMVSLYSSLDSFKIFKNKIELSLYATGEGEQLVVKRLSLPRSRQKTMVSEDDMRLLRDEEPADTTCFLRLSNVQKRVPQKAKGSGVVE